MIKLIAVEVVEHGKLRLTFSDGRYGLWDAAEIMARDTVLTNPLTQPGYFARAFIEAGALAWPNGLELAPWTLHTELEKAGKLEGQAA